MDFGLNDDQQQLVDATLDFARKRLGGDPIERDAAHEFDREGWAALADQGILGLVVPERDGGLGLGALDSALVMEALGRGCRDTGLCFSAAAHLFACTVPLVRYGTAEQKARFLPGMMDGSVIATHAISEPDAGSDVGSMGTKAVRDGGGWALNGSKSYASNGPVADLFLVHAMTDPGGGYLGITAFLVERGADGLSVSGNYQKLGLRTSPIGDVFLDGVRVEDTARLGGVGAGGHVFTHSMNWERVCLFAIYLGVMQEQLDTAVRHARQRKAFGKRIGQFQGVSHRIADMAVRLESARWMLYRAAWELDQGGRGIAVESAMAKLVVSQAAIASSLDAIAVHGGLGIMEETGVARQLRDAVPSSIFSGTTEMQRNVIARSLGVG